MFKGLIMDRCVLLTSTPECVVSPHQAITRAQLEWSPRGETTHDNRVCCLAAPDNHKGTAARQHTQELMSTTHTYPWSLNRCAEQIFAEPNGSERDQRPLTGTAPVRVTRKCSSKHTPATRLLEQITVTTAKLRGGAQVRGIPWVPRMRHCSNLS